MGGKGSERFDGRIVAATLPTGRQALGCVTQAEACGYFSLFVIARPELN